MCKRHFYSLVLAIALASFLPATNAAPKPPPIEDRRKLIQAGWKLPYPPYPAEARIHHEEGTVYLQIKTDAAGKITKITILDDPPSTKSETLRKSTLSYARSNWSGPPNSTARTAIEHSLGNLLLYRPPAR